VATDTARMNAWPKPFAYPDRLSVRAPFAAMAANGWRARTTLGDFHFEEGTQKLNYAGELKVRWIVNHTPPEFRRLYVLQGFSREETEQRYAAAQDAIAKALPRGPALPVLVTGVEPPHRSATYIEAIDRKATDAIPSPVLPAADGDN
jgi:hypothetical protein